MPETLVIYNPVAGRGRVRELWPKVERRLREKGLQFDVAPTQWPLHALTLAEQAPTQYRQVIAVGGDGTVHEMANGLLRASGEKPTIPLGIIPLGNGDDFVKSLPPLTPVGGKPYSWEMAVDIIASGQCQFVDAGRIYGGAQTVEALGEGPRYFINGMNLGFSAHAAYNYTTIPGWITGFSAYLAAVFKTMVQYPALHLRISLDNQAPFEQVTTMVAIMNGRCFGNGFWVNPQGDAGDGCLEAMVTKQLSRTTILQKIPKIMKGTHIGDPVVDMYQARRLTIESPHPLIVEADGEIPYLGVHRLQVEALERRLCVISGIGD